MPEDPVPDAELGRRERTKRERRQRIVSAASELFGEQGYGATTTQQIADAADIGAGTLFRYFPTKADLLVEVMGQDIRGGIEQAVVGAAQGGDLVGSIVGLIMPLANAGIDHPENITAYLRETLFGAPNLRAIGTAQGMAIPAAIEQVLARHAAGAPVRDGVDLRDVADAIYAMVWLEGIRIITQGKRIDRQRVRHVVEFLVEGLVLPA